MKKNYYRALQIIQDEEYLEAADHDEIKRQKRQFAINIFDDVIDRIPVSRQKRQSTLFGTGETVSFFDPSPFFDPCLIKR